MCEHCPKWKTFVAQHFLYANNRLLWLTMLTAAAAVATAVVVVVVAMTITIEWPTDVHAMNLISNYLDRNFASMLSTQSIWLLILACSVRMSRKKKKTKKLDGLASIDQAAFVNARLRLCEVSNKLSHENEKSIQLSFEPKNIRKIKLWLMTGKFLFKMGSAPSSRHHTSNIAEDTSKWKIISWLSISVKNLYINYDWDWLDGARRWMERERNEYEIGSNTGAKVNWPENISHSICCVECGMLTMPPTRDRCRCCVYLFGSIIIMAIDAAPVLG